MADTTVYGELHTALNNFHEFLKTQAAPVAEVVATIAGIVPQVNDLIDKPITLLQKLKQELKKIISVVPGDVTTVLEYAQRMKGFVEAMRAIIPGESATIDSVADVADVIAGIPSLDQVKDEIFDLIDKIIVLLQSMQSTSPN